MNEIRFLFLILIVFVEEPTYPLYSLSGRRLALLFHSQLSTRFWVDAFSTAAYIINRLPTPLLEGKSPFELFYGSSPNYAYFHPFGFSVYPCLRDYMPKKFSPRSIPCIFLGESPSYKGFRCFDPSSRSRPPGMLPYKSTSSSTPPF
jgi:hypothetical protein